MRIYAFQRDEYGGYTLVVKDPVTKEFKSVSVCNTGGLESVIYEKGDSDESDGGTWIPKIPYNSDIKTYIDVLNNKLPIVS